MPLETVALHLGAHKTGTSLIQKFIRDNAAMCQKAGIAGIARSETDRTIAWGRVKDVEQGREDLRAHIDRASEKGLPFFVLSHENAMGRPFDADKGAGRLYPYARRRASALRDALDGYPIKVIYYIRSAAAFMESYYLQTIHEGGYTPFRKWRKQTGTPSLSWGPVYDDLCSVFGAENVTIKSFDAEIAQGQSEFLRSFFASFMEPAPQTEALNNYEYPPVRNPSIGEKGLELALAVNPLLGTSTERKLMRKFLQTHFSNQTHPRAVLLSGKEKIEIGEAMHDDIDTVLSRQRDLREETAQQAQPSGATAAPGDEPR